jgi:hypothetical protein
MDFHCILNEPIWFNRFLYLPTDKTHGRILKTVLEVKLVKKGFLHLKDFYSLSNSTNGSSHWLSRVEAIAKTGTIRLFEALMSIIGLVPASWSKVVISKSREPFQVGDWCICDEPATPQVPRFIYKVAKIRSGKLLCTRYRLPHDQAPFIHDDINAAENIRKTDLVKACVLQAATAKKQLGPIYCGNYKYSELLLSRLSWPANGKSFTFFDFTIHMLYQSLTAANFDSITAIDKWEKDLNVPFAASWPKRIAYINDCVLHNRTKEKLYRLLHVLCLLAASFLIL